MVSLVAAQAKQGIMVPMYVAMAAFIAVGDGGMVGILPAILVLRGIYDDAEGSTYVVREIATYAKGSVLAGYVFFPLANYP